jgi:pyruvate/2-oxoglutarate dehydrogenase complex dihydrolipoamide acyltransferase (E2) component
MPTEILLPPLESAAEQATIERYFHTLGDAVTPGQPLAIVVTERFEWEIPATAAGLIDEIVAQPGASVAVGAPLVRLTVVEAVAPPAPADVAVNGHRAERPPRATPLARKIATVHELDLATISGSGRGGLITRADVLSQAQAQSLVVVEPGVRLGFSLDPIARRPDNLPAPITTRSDRARPAQPQITPHTQSAPANAAWRTPHAIAAVELDLSAALAYVAAHGQRLARRGITLTPTSCVAAAVVATLAEHRLLNSVWSEDGVILRRAVHLAVVQHERAAGRMTQRIVAQAAELNVQGLARALSSDPADDEPAATFTLAEAGATHWSEALVPDGQAALLSLGAIEQRPLVVERAGVDTIVIRPLALLALIYDARVIALPQADAFLSAVKRRVEHFNAL